ncbi:MAG: DUF2325 domain-containing protein [Candidatus Sabulitectum sp.]|nr:DUF2325 domain-containing protein [Candidatus Sabulitectum sp.]
MKDQKGQGRGREFQTLFDYQRCVLLGACLTTSEKKKLLRNAGYRLKGFSQIGIHRLLVKASSDDEKLARRIDSMFRNRYDKRAEVLDEYSEIEIVPMWREYLTGDDYQWLIWASMTDAKLSDDFAAGVLGDFHALQHKISREAGKKTERIEKLCRKVEALEEKLKAARKRERNYKRQCSESVKSMNLNERLLAGLKKKLEDVEQFAKDSGVGQVNSSLLKLRIRELEFTVARNADEIRKHIASKDRIQIQLQVVKEKNRLGRDEILNLLDLMRCKDADCIKCPNRDLCDRNVLLVGGITRLESIYKDLVISTGGDFKYHNGKSNAGEKLLQERIRWADVVLCPVDVNSHRAALGVKKICKKMEKPFMMLRSSSVTSISKALDRVAAGENNLLR